MNLHLPLITYWRKIFKFAALKKSENKANLFENPKQWALQPGLQLEQP